MSQSADTSVAMEIHDSTLERVESAGDAVIAVFRAYVHRSSGRPGIDPGSGFLQTVTLRFEHASVAGTLHRIPMELLDGYLELPSGRLENHIPLPFHFAGSATLNVSGWAPDQITIHGDALAAIAVGEAQYVEDFNPSPSDGQDQT